MPDSATIGASFEQHTPQPLLGGASNMQPVVIDVNPLVNLARFANSRNMFFWRQENDDAKELAKQFAETSENLKLSDLYEADQKALNPEIAEAVNKIRDLASFIPKGAKDRLDVFRRIEEIKRPILDKYNAAKNRMASRTLRQATISTTFSDNPNLQSVYLKRLDEELNNKAGSMQDIDPLIPIKPEDVEIPQATSRTIQWNTSGANIDNTNQMSISTPEDNLAAANNLVAGFDKITQSAETDPEVQGTIITRGTSIANAARDFNSVINNYRNANGTFDRDAFLKANADNPAIKDVYDMLVAMDERSRSMINRIARGEFIDRGEGGTGRSHLTADEFSAGLVDFSAPIPSNKIALAAIMRDAPVENVVTTPKRHNTAITGAREAARLRIQERSAATSEFNARTNYAAAGGQFDSEGRPTFKFVSKSNEEKTDAFDMPQLMYQGFVSQVAKDMDPKSNYVDIPVSEIDTRMKDVLTLIPEGATDSNGKDIRADAKIRVNRDGTVFIYRADKHGNAESQPRDVLNETTIMQNLISNVKSEQSGSLDAGFQSKSEEGFERLRQSAGIGKTQSLMNALLGVLQQDDTATNTTQQNNAETQSSNKPVVVPKNKQSAFK